MLLIHSWCTGVLLAPLLTLPEAAPLGVDSAQAAAAAADARAASPDALSAVAATHEDASVAARCAGTPATSRLAACLTHWLLQCPAACMSAVNTFLAPGLAGALAMATCVAMCAGRRCAGTWMRRWARLRWRAAGHGSRCWTAGRCGIRVDNHILTTAPKQPPVSLTNAPPLAASELPWMASASVFTAS